MAPDGQQHPPLIQALLRPEAYPHPVQRLELIETHISWVILTGGIAYKIKKPVELGFVQAATLQQRLHYCHEELRLNRRLAPDLYLDVVPVFGPETEAHIGAISLDQDGRTNRELIDAAVKMLEFAPQQLLSTALAKGTMTSTQLSNLAWTLGKFHQQAPVAEPTGPWGTAQSVCEPVFTNLTVLDSLVVDPDQQAHLQQHRRWAEGMEQRLAARFTARHQSGAIRECHGDLHCGNIRCDQNGQLQVFDAIDFNAQLRWIDPISEMAFLVMDLGTHGDRAQPIQLLNDWLECTGDYDGLDLWPWYHAYRAMVRAKVSALQSENSTDANRRERLQKDLQRYLQVAAASEQPATGGLVLMHGLSGSGKSTLSGQFIGPLQAVRIRSDRERARAFLPTNRHPPRWTGDRYRQEVTHWLFHHHLPALVERSLESGYTVIVDATFLRHKERQLMISLAERRQRNWAIVKCQCSHETAKLRLDRRQQDGVDPSEADLTVRVRQEQWLEPLDQKEQQRTLVADETSNPNQVAASLLRLLNEPPA